MKKNTNLNDELVRACKTCQNGKEIAITGDYLCMANGVVNANYLCKKYQLNSFLKRPPKKRRIDISGYNTDDFKI